MNSSTSSVDAASLPGNGSSAIAPQNPSLWAYPTSDNVNYLDGNSYDLAGYPYDAVSDNYYGATGNSYSSTGNSYSSTGSSYSSGLGSPLLSTIESDFSKYDSLFEDDSSIKDKEDKALNLEDVHLKKAKIEFLKDFLKNLSLAVPKDFIKIDEFLKEGSSKYQDFVKKYNELFSKLRFDLLNLKSSKAKYLTNFQSVFDSFFEYVEGLNSEKYIKDSYYKDEFSKVLGSCFRTIFSRELIDNSTTQEEVFNKFKFSFRNFWESLQKLNNKPEVNKSSTKEDLLDDGVFSIRNCYQDSVDFLDASDECNRSMLGGGPLDGEPEKAVFLILFRVMSVVYRYMLEASPTFAGKTFKDVYGTFFERMLISEDENLIKNFFESLTTYAKNFKDILENLLAFRESDLDSDSINKLRQYYFLFGPMFKVVTAALKFLLTDIRELGKKVKQFVNEIGSDKISDNVRELYDFIKNQKILDRDSNFAKGTVIFNLFLNQFNVRSFLTKSVSADDEATIDGKLKGEAFKLADFSKAFFKNFSLLVAGTKLTKKDFDKAVNAEATDSKFAFETMKTKMLHRDTGLFGKPLQAIIDYHGNGPGSLGAQIAAAETDINDNLTPAKDAAVREEGVAVNNFNDEIKVLTHNPDDKKIYEDVKDKFTTEADFWKVVEDFLRIVNAGGAGVDAALDTFYTTLSTNHNTIWADKNAAKNTFDKLYAVTNAGKGNQKSLELAKGLYDTWVTKSGELQRAQGSLKAKEDLVKKLEKDLEYQKARASKLKAWFNRVKNLAFMRQFVDSKLFEGRTLNHRAAAVGLGDISKVIVKDSSGVGELNFDIDPAIKANGALKNDWLKTLIDFFKPVAGLDVTGKDGKALKDDDIVKKYTKHFEDLCNNLINLSEMDLKHGTKVSRAFATSVQKAAEVFGNLAMAVSKIDFSQADVAGNDGNLKLQDVFTAGFKKYFDAAINKLQTIDASEFAFLFPEIDFDNLFNNLKAEDVEIDGVDLSLSPRPWIDEVTGQPANAKFSFNVDWDVPVAPDMFEDDTKAKGINSAALVNTGILVSTGQVYESFFNTIKFFREFYKTYAYDAGQKAAIGSIVKNMLTERVNQYSLLFQNTKAGSNARNNSNNIFKTYLKTEEQQVLIDAFLKGQLDVVDLVKELEPLLNQSVAKNTSLPLYIETLPLLYGKAAAGGKFDLQAFDSVAGDFGKNLFKNIINLTDDNRVNAILDNYNYDLTADKNLDALFSIASEVKGLPNLFDSKNFVNDKFTTILLGSLEVLDHFNYKDKFNRRGNNIGFTLDKIKKLFAQAVKSSYRFGFADDDVPPKIVEKKIADVYENAENISTVRDPDCAAFFYSDAMKPITGLNLENEILNPIMNKMKNSSDSLKQRLTNDWKNFTRLEDEEQIKAENENKMLKKKRSYRSDKHKQLSKNFKSVNENFQKVNDSLQMMASALEGIMARVDFLENKVNNVNDSSRSLQKVSKPTYGGPDSNPWETAPGFGTTTTTTPNLWDAAPNSGTTTTPNPWETTTSGFGTTTTTPNLWDAAPNSGTTTTPNPWETTTSGFGTTATTPNLWETTTSGFGTTTTTTPNLWETTTPGFGTTTTTTPNLWETTTPGFGATTTTPNLWETTTPGFGTTTTPNPWETAPGFGTTTTPNLWEEAAPTFNSLPSYGAFDDFSAGYGGSNLGFGDYNNFDLGYVF